MKTTIVLALLIAVLGGIVHYLPEPRLTVQEIAFHQYARNFTYGIGSPDPLLRTRGAQIRIVPVDPPQQTAAIEVSVEWIGLLILIMSGIYAIITKLIIAQAMKEADAKYVHLDVAKVDAQRLEEIFAQHLVNDERRFNSIDRQLGEIWDAVK